MKKQSWKEYVHFSRKERNALIIICLVTIATVIIPYVIPAKKQTVSIDTSLQQQLDAISQPPDSSVSHIEQGRQTYQQQPKPNEPIASAELFAFDPNTLDEAGWKRLGLRDKAIKTILNYRNKGGHFKNPEDLAKIYGLQDEAARLIPYAHIEAQQSTKLVKEAKPVAVAGGQKAAQPAFPKKQFKPININSATADDWKSLPGIGDVLAGRIINFRNKIGGFKTIEQVGKTYGLKDSVFQEMKPYLIME